jgi:ABC-type nickel/cobalt efflux system permease component RcnA
MFFIALLLFSFYYSNTSTRVFVVVASALLSVLTVWCIRRAWESSDGVEAWFGSLMPSITRAFSHARDRCHNLLAVMSPRGHLASHTQEHGNSAHTTPNHEEGEVV